MRDLRILASVLIFLMWPGSASAQRVRSGEIIFPRPPLGPSNPSSYWVNVRDFGAKGDGVTDDTPAILAALHAGSGAFLGKALVLYFPPSPHFYYIGTPLKLPQPSNWVTLYFDTGLLLGATLSATSGYVLYGNSGGQITSFSKDKLTLFGTTAGADPVVDITGITDFRMENIQFTTIESRQGIVINNSAEIALKNVWLPVNQSRPTGIPLTIHGGFGIYVDDGGFASSPAGTSPSVLITDDATECNFSGMVRLRGTFLAAHGVAVQTTCGDVNSLSFDDILYESSLDPFLTIAATNPTLNPIVWGIQIRDVNMADEFLEASGIHPPLVRVLDNFRVYSVQITNSWADGQICKDGYPIGDLEVMAQAGCYVYGQTSGYVITEGGGVIDTRTVLSPSIQPPEFPSGVSSKALAPAHSLPSASHWPALPKWPQ